MANVRIDRLQRLVQMCLAYARSGAFSQEVRDAFLARAEALRDELANATEAAWQAADSELDDLNARVEVAIGAISDEQNVENSFAATIATVTNVVTIVGKIVKPF